MPRFTTQKRVEHEAGQMFDLIADVERYPEFLPMCEALTIRSRREKGERVLLIADMTVGYKMIRESFTSQVYLFREAMLIDVKYIDGPFKHMENRWRFFPIEGEAACMVDFYIDYEFKSKMLGMVMGSVFDMAFRRFVSAYEARADALYGRQLPPLSTSSFS